jgi:hypothetical protein
VDVSDSQRFEKSWGDKQQQAWLGQILVLDAREQRLDAWYEEDDPDEH